MRSDFWPPPPSPVASRSFLHGFFSAVGTELGQSSSHCLALQATELKGADILLSTAKFK